MAKRQLHYQGESVAPVAAPTAHGHTYHVVSVFTTTGKDVLAECSIKLVLDGDRSVSADEVPPIDRCQRQGCATKWPVKDEEKRTAS